MASKTLDVALNAKDNMSPAFDKAGNSAKQLGDSLDNLGKNAGSGFSGFLAQIQSVDSEIRTVGQALTGFGVGITAGVAVGVKQFASLEAAMQNVSTIAGQSDAWIGNMTEQIRGLAVELGTSPTGLAEGLYDLIGSGIDSADALDVLRVSAVAAKAGLTDTGTAATAITAVLNAYGLEASEAGKISDVLFKTVDSGVISFEELSGSLGRALPLANVLKVSIEELGAAYAQLTRQGLSASEAETSFTALLTAALNPTEALTEAVQEYGYANAEAMIQQEGFTAFLQFLDDVAGGSATRMSELTGNVRATNGALILAQDGASGFVDRLVEMEDAAGATSAAFEIQMDTINASLARARAGFNDLAITVGAAVAPAVDAAATAMSGWATVIGSLPDGLQNVAAIAGTAAGGIALFSGGLLLVVPRIADTVAALGALKTALGAGRLAMIGFAGATATVATAFGVLGAFIGAGAGGFIGEFIGSLRDGEGAVKAFSDSTNVLAAALDKLRSGDVLGFFDTLANGIDQASSAMEAFNQTSSTLLTEAARQSVLGNEEVAKGIERLVETSDWALARAQVRVEDTAWLHQQTAIQVEATGQTWTQAEEAVRESMTETNAEMAVRTEALHVLAQAYLDPSVNRDQMQRDVELLDAQMAAGTITLDEHRDGLVKLARQYGDMPNDINETADAIAGLNDVANATGGALSGLTTDMLANAEAAEEERQRIQELKEEWIQGALSVAGFDNALSTLNMTGLTGEIGMFAEGWTRANQAMDNSFRIIIGNTNAMIQQVDGIQSWADSLINVRGELGEIDQLLEGGFIDETIYANAQTAYDGISTSVGNIRNNLLAVQAIQAPWIAEVVAGTERWAAELRQMPEEVQRTTLAFMDLQTVTQAQELITLGNSEAFRNMNEEGRAAFEATIQGAIQINPLLFDVLKTMGIINGTPLDFEVDYTALMGAGSAIEQLTTQVAYLVDTLRAIYGLDPLNVDVDTSGVEQAAETVDFLYERIQNADGTEAFVVIRVDETGAETVDQIVSSVDNLDGTYTVQVEAETGETYEAVLAQDGTVISTTYVDIVPQIAGGYSAAAGGAVPGSSMGADAFKSFLGIPDTIDATVSVTGADEVAQVKADIESIDDKTVTVDVVIGTNELDTGLTSWGFGTGGGGGGAAGFEGKQVSVDILIGDNELDTALDGEFGPVTVDIEANMTAFAASLATIGLGGAGMPAVEIPITANKDAFWQEMAELDGILMQRPAVSIPVAADAADAIGQLEAVAGAATAADALSVAVPVATPGSGEGIGQLEGVAGAAAAADAMSVTIPVNVLGASVAIGALNSVADAAANANRTVTITTNVVTAYSTVGSPGVGITRQHGGIPSYATGGVLFRGGEAGPEIAHFAGGGTALLPRDGLYTAPPMTYISPHNSSASYGGDTYSFFEGATFIGTDRDEMNRWAAEEFLPMFERAKQQRDIAKGLTA